MSPIEGIHIVTDGNLTLAVNSYGTTIEEIPIIRTTGNNDLSVIVVEYGCYHT
jgi:hypothetical protein